MTTGPHTPRPSAAQRALATVAGSRVARFYLLAVLVLLIWVAVDTNFVHQDDASLAAVFPMLATLPWGFAVTLLPEGSSFGYYLVIIAAALINAALLSKIGRSRSTSRSQSRNP